MNRTGRPEKAARSAFTIRCRRIFSRRTHKAHSCTCIFLPIWLKGGQALLLQEGKSMAHTIVTIVGWLRKESFSLKIANALAKLAPASLKLDVTTLEGISFFNQDLEADPAGRLAGVPRKAAEVERRAVRDARIQPLDPRRPEERHRRRLASLRQELVPRQAGRHRQQFARARSAASARPSICRTSCPVLPARSSASPKSI